MHVEATSAEVVVVQRKHQVKESVDEVLEELQLDKRRQRSWGIARRIRRNV